MWLDSWVCWNIVDLICFSYKGEMKQCQGNFCGFTNSWGQENVILWPFDKWLVSHGEFQLIDSGVCELKESDKSCYPSQTLISIQNPSNEGSQRIDRASKKIETGINQYCKCSPLQRIKHCWYTKWPVKLQKQYPHELKTRETLLWWSIAVTLEYHSECMLPKRAPEMKCSIIQNQHWAITQDQSFHLSFLAEEVRRLGGVFG